jgi:hypothetical protein
MSCFTSQSTNRMINRLRNWPTSPEAGVLDEPYSVSQLSGVAIPARQAIGWTRFQPMQTGGPVRQLR